MVILLKNNFYYFKGDLAMKPSQRLIISFFTFLGLFILSNPTIVYAGATQSSLYLDFDEFVPCANGGYGENVHITGTIHDVFYTNIDRRGCIHVKYVSNAHGIIGTGEVTGDTYHGTGSFKYQEKYCVDPLDSWPQVFNYVDNYRIIGPGPDNNLVLHINAHITINAEGETTVDFENYETDCK